MPAAPRGRGCRPSCPAQPQRRGISRYEDALAALIAILLGLSFRAGLRKRRAATCPDGVFNLSGRG